MITGPEVRERLIRALGEAWRTDVGVRDFKLSFDPKRIREEEGVWSIPVASGVSEGSARELLRVFDRLEDAVEGTTSLHVMVFLDLGDAAPTNGDKN